MNSARTFNTNLSPPLKIQLCATSEQLSYQPPFKPNILHPNATKISYSLVEPWKMRYDAKHQPTSIIHRLSSNAAQYNRLFLSGVNEHNQKDGSGCPICRTWQMRAHKSTVSLYCTVPSARHLTVLLANSQTFSKRTHWNGAHNMKESVRGVSVNENARVWTRFWPPSDFPLPASVTFRKKNFALVLALAKWYTLYWGMPDWMYVDIRVRTRCGRFCGSYVKERIAVRIQ